MIDGRLLNPYSAKDVEDKIYKIWEESGYFNPDNLPTTQNLPAHAITDGKPKTYTMVIPPPNVTGSLHMGHALNATIQDILIRKKRMEGFKTLWLVGTDHAGIATQNVVEKKLKKEGVSRHDLGREKFLEKVWEWKEEYGNIILGQLKKLGSSCDWSRIRFTMDPEYQRAVTDTFIHYYKKGWIYRGERVINWCRRCRTSLSDLELEYKEEKGSLWFIKYPLKDGSGNVIVATTRPETMLGDTAVAVNPNDKRYKDLIGKTIILPLQNREIPIVASRKIDKEFGTGAVKITPAHDMLDAEIGEENKLEFIQVIGENGKMTELAGKNYEGLSVKDARIKVVEDLEKEELIEKIEDHTHNLSVCYRCSVAIEPLLSKQWFVKMDELAKMAIDAVENKKVKFHPAKWNKIYLEWLNNIRDWNISRQIWWGHQIPAFYCVKELSDTDNEEQFVVADKKPSQCPFCKSCEMKQSEEVLDTWFSSALWPYATLKYYNEKDFENFYPTQALSTARDIINLWVARMVYSSVEFTAKTPFDDVIIHATILTKDGKRMSKSLGTGIDPLNLITNYGADATRFGLIWQAMQNQDMHWAEESLVAGKKFLNKIWNASRFVMQRTEDKNFEITDSESLPNLEEDKLTEADKEIIDKLNNIIKNTDKNIEEYQFGQSLHNLYDFFWHDFCDNYLESAKNQIEDESLKENTQKILLHVLINSIKLLHPFIPFATEEIWRMVPINKKQLLIVESWPKKLS